MNVLNVAVWGLGSHAKNRILPALSMIKEIRLIGVCSRNLKSVEVCAESWDCYGWTDSDQMLNSNEVDIIYIATPIALHFPFAKKAIEAGKHVWCEKPLTSSYTDAQTLVSLAEREEKVLTESFMYLYHPQFQRVKKFIDNSKEIKSVICRFGIPTMENPGFRNDPKLCGGAFWDVGSYTTSALLSLFHNQETHVLFSEILTKKGMKVDNEGRALLRFSNDVTAYLEWSIGVAYKNEIELWGMHNSFFTDKIFSKTNEYQPQYKIRDLNGNENVEYGKPSEQFIDMLTYFVEIMNDREKAAVERNNILQRAKLMNDIVNFNGVKK